MIVMFVMVFTVFLVLGAFAIDQGYWFGRRRVTQSVADNAARAAAAAYIGDLSAQPTAQALAIRTAGDNGITAGVTPIASNTCTGTDPNGNTATIDAPSIEVQLTTQARRFLSSVPLISGGGTSVEVGARAVACLGRVTRLYVGNDEQPYTGSDLNYRGNTLKGVPIAIRSNAGGPRSCFSSGDLILAEECVIFGSKNRPVSVSRTAWANRRMIFEKPTSQRCEGVDDIPDSIPLINGGVTFTCTVNTGGSCTGTSMCINTENINNDDNQERVFNAMELRLKGSTNCASRESGEPSPSFQNAFGNGAGNPELAPDPPALGGVGSPQHVYVQNDCYDNPRIVVLPIVSSGVNDGAPEEPVRGFATVFITGCYRENDDTATPAQMESNNCDRDWRINECQDDVGEDPTDPHDEDCHWEIRAIPIHILVAGESLGGIAEPTTNAPLTIQTVK